MTGHDDITDLYAVTEYDGAPFIVEATVSDDWQAAATTYDVRASGVRGAFVVRPYLRTYGDEEIDLDTDAVLVEYGRHKPGDPRPAMFEPHWELRDRADRPVVNGVRLISVSVIHTNNMRAQRLTGWYVNVWRPVGEHRTGWAPDKTTARTAAVLQAIVSHWLCRDPHTLVHRITAAAQQVKDQRANDALFRHRAEEEIERQRAKLAALDEREARRAVYLTAPPPVLP